jgi:HIRAN domain
MEGILWLAVVAIVLAVVTAIYSGVSRGTSPSPIRQPASAVRMGPLTDGEFLSAVAGESQRNPDGTWRQDIIRRCTAGDPVELVPESGNVHDPNAVKVMHDLGLIGYIPRANAARFAIEIDDGCVVTASIHEIIGRDKGTLGVVLRVLVEDPSDNGDDLSVVATGRARYRL